MRLLLMPRELTWWIWLATATLLALGLAGHEGWFVAAIVLSFAHTGLFAWRSRSFRDFPVQVRLTYSVCLCVYALPPLRGFNWVPMLGTYALVLFGYCLLARILSLAPWNRGQPLTFPLVARTFLTPPRVGNVRQGLPMSGGARCHLERMAGSIQ